MSAQLPFLPKPIQPGDPRGFAGFEHEGQIYQPRRLETRQPVVIAGLQAGIVYELDLTKHLGHDLLVTGLTCDIVEDDGKELQAGEDNKYRQTYVQAIIQQLDPSTKKVKREIVVFISSYPNYQNELVLNHDALYQIKLNKSVNDITFLGIPVVLKPSVIVHDLPVIDQPSTRDKGR